MMAAGEMLPSGSGSWYEWELVFGVPSLIRCGGTRNLTLPPPLSKPNAVSW